MGASLIISGLVPKTIAVFIDIFSVIGGIIMSIERIRRYSSKYSQTHKDETINRFIFINCCN